MEILHSMLRRTGLTGSGTVITEERPVGDFTQVMCSGVGNLIIEQTGTESLAITAEDNIVPLITTEVGASVLRIGMKPGFTPKPTKPITYRLTVKHLEGIRMSGVGDVTAQQLDGRDLDITLTGAGSGTILGLTILHAHVTLSGAGDLTLAGTTAELTVKVSGVGSFHGGDLQSEKADVRVTGAGSATVRVSNELNATVSGVGSINYIGDPLLARRITGVGKVAKLASH
jgi:hypothetical protein